MSRRSLTRAAGQTRRASRGNAGSCRTVPSSTAAGVASSESLELHIDAATHAVCCRFEGAFDLRALVGAAQGGRVLNPVQLNGVASTVQVGEGLQAATRRHAALSRLVVPIEPAIASMLACIRQRIEPDDARILDRASTGLGKLRQRRRDNAHALRRAIEDWARKLHAQGISERAQVLARLV